VGNEGRHERKQQRARQRRQKIMAVEHAAVHQHGDEPAGGQRKHKRPFDRQHVPAPGTTEPIIFPKG
jgi:hypothetical protein